MVVSLEVVTLQTVYLLFLVAFEILSLTLVFSSFITCVDIIINKFDIHCAFLDYVLH